MLNFNRGGRLGCFNSSYGAGFGNLRALPTPVVACRLALPRSPRRTTVPLSNSWQRPCRRPMWCMVARTAQNEWRDRLALYLCANERWTFEHRVTKIVTLTKTYTVYSVLGSINDTCIMIRIMIQKMYQVSSIKIQYCRCISISITDTLTTYQYHESLIYSCL